MTKRIMDDATRKKLMGLLPFKPNSFAEVTPDEFNGVDESLRPVFRIRGLGNAPLEKWRKAVRAGDGNVPLDEYIDALSQGDLDGWNNLVDFVTGDEIPSHIENLKYFPEKLILWLFGIALKFTHGPTEEEKTGLESLPPPTSAQ